MATQPSSKTDRLHAGDEQLFTFPLTGKPVTINETHALLLGLSGFAPGMLFAAGSGALACLLTLALLGYALFGRRAETNGTIAMRTMVHEPWWFTTSLLACFVLGAVTF